MVKFGNLLQKSLFLVRIAKYNYLFLEYDNLEVFSADPPTGSNISLSLTEIAITYKVPVTKSSNKISIYENVAGRSVFRQIIPPESMSYSDDQKTVRINVLPCTFNNPNSDYYITIEDDAIQNSETNQPLIGIDKNIWNLHTGK